MFCVLWWSDAGPSGRVRCWQVQIIEIMPRVQNRAAKGSTPLWRRSTLPIYCRYNIYLCGEYREFPVTVTLNLVLLLLIQGSFILETIHVTFRQDIHYTVCHPKEKPVGLSNHLDHAAASGQAGTLRTGGLMNIDIHIHVMGGHSNRFYHVHLKYVQRWALPIWNVAPPRCYISIFSNGNIYFLNLIITFNFCLLICH